MNFIDSKIQTYAERYSSVEPALLKRLARATRQRTAWPRMMVGHMEGLFLKLLAKLTRARRILEIGTFTGYSALAMAEALPKNGKLITLDIDPVNTKIARKFWKKHSAGRRIELRLGPALQTLERLKGPFDLAFIDADKTNYARYWDALLPKMRRGGVLLVDNVLWSGEVLKPQTADAQALAAFNRKVKADRRVETILLPIRDGLTLAVKK